MCSRFEISATARKIMAALKLTPPPPLPNMPVIRPTDMSLIVTGSDALLQPWGLSVDWTKQPMINARAETLTEKPTFRPLLEKRCIVPATAYFEWRTDESGKKRKNRIRTTDAPVFAMAGLTDGERFTVVTCAPAESVAHIHNRMPAILTTDALERWLSPAPFADVRDVLAPYAGALDAEEETPPPPAQADLFG